jgi:predicted nucleotide-binding protein (sugar kinase/HSP70/actin superfamily)
MALEKEGMPVKVVKTSSFNLVQRLWLNMDMMLWEMLIISHDLRHIGHSLRPYEVEHGITDRTIEEALKIMKDAIEQKKNKIQMWEKVAGMFREIQIRKTPRPRVLILGDLYVKNNDAFNQNVVRRIEELGGEVVGSSIMEYFHYSLELGRYEGEQNLTQMATDYVLKKILENLENSYSRPIQPLLSPLKEPSWDTVFASLEKMGLDLGLHGETAMTISRAAAMAQSGQIQAIVHVNPLFCCPGNVSASLLEKIREDFSIPVLNIFYDGTDQPNIGLVPFMHYLCQQVSENLEETKV